MATLLDQIDSLLRGGQAGSAQEALLTQRHQLKRAAGKDRSRLAALYRRAGLPRESLRLLIHRVRPTGRKAIRALEGERLEYAAALIACGATREGADLLRELDPRALPETLLQSAFALFREWDYANAIPALESFVSSPKVDAYRRRVGEINLAAALVHERMHEKSEPLLHSLLSQTESEGSWRLHANALELAAQAAVERGDWPESQRRLDRATKLLSEGKGVDALYVRKWTAIMELRRSPKDGADACKAIQRDAHAQGDWETVRDMDRELGLALGDEERLRRLYFGTPYPAYRKRLIMEMNERGANFAPGDSFGWILGESDRHLTLSLGGKQPGLKLDQVVDRVLRALSTDFYAPLSPVTLHARVHPDRHFNIFSSPNLVHRNVARARVWLKEHAAGLFIDFRDGAYRFECRRKRAKIEVFLDSPTSKLRTAPPKAVFSIRDYVSSSGLPQRSAQRLLAQEVAMGRLLKQGTGKATRYSFPGPS